MQSVEQKISDKYKKKAVVDIRSGDTVKVHQKIREGGKERVQIFEGIVIKTTRPSSFTSSFTVRRISSGVGVEKTYLIHSPNILKVEVVKRSRVRRNYLSYMRGLTGKNARLSAVEFDRDAVNAIADEEAEAEEAKLHDEKEKEHEELEAKKTEEQAVEAAKVDAAIAEHGNSNDEVKNKKPEAETSEAKAEKN